MRARLLMAILIAMALTVGAALGFFFEQADQPTESMQQLPEN